MEAHLGVVAGRLARRREDHELGVARTRSADRPGRSSTGSSPSFSAYQPRARSRSWAGSRMACARVDEGADSRARTLALFFSQYAGGRLDQLDVVAVRVLDRAEPQAGVAVLDR